MSSSKQSSPATGSDRETNRLDMRDKLSTSLTEPPLFERRSLGVALRDGMVGLLLPNPRIVTKVMPTYETQVGV